MESKIKIISKYSDYELEKYFNEEELNRLHKLKLYLGVLWQFINKKLKSTGFV